MINEKVTQCLLKMKQDPSSVIEADLEVFCPEAKEDKFLAMKQLIYTMGNDSDHNIQKISFKNNFTFFLIFL